MLAPHAKLRAQIVPAGSDNETEHAADHVHAHHSPARLSWARLLQRVFEIDLASVKGTMNTARSAAAP